jgi:hypothetical protein
MRQVMAILCSDIHLQARAPVARAGELSWWEAMARPLREVAALQRQHRCPVLVAGDVFDRWNAPPEVINFAFQELPDGCIAIPGQHDLPHHALPDIRRSAYWTLVEAGRMGHLEPGVHHIHTPGDKLLRVGAFPWGCPLQPVEPKKDVVSLALVHRYCWKTGSGYTGAPETAKVGRHMRDLGGYDVAVFGDNHKGFLIDVVQGGPVVLNCGGFMRRTSDELGYQPHIGLLYEDGEVERHALDCTQDVMQRTQAAEVAVVENAIDAGTFLAELEALGCSRLDFEAALKHHMDANKTSARVRELVLGAVNGR